MSLIADYQDSFGGPRVARFPDWATDRLPADLDLAGFDILGLDLGDLEFAAQPAHYVYAGPASGPNAAPAFRLLTASEIGAVEENDVLTELIQSGVLFDSNQLGWSISVGGNLDFSGAFSLVGGFSTIFNFDANTELDFPATGTLASLAGAERLTNKVVNGLTLSGKVASGIGPAPTDYDFTVVSPDVFKLSHVKVGGYIGGEFNIRTTGSTDVTMPRAGLLAVVGSKTDAVCGATKASASTVDLTAVEEFQVDITGSATINAITLAEGEIKTLRFTSTATLNSGASLLTPNAVDITAVNGAYAIIIGGAAGVVTVKEFGMADDFNVHYGGDFSTGGSFRTIGNFTAQGLVNIEDNFSVIGAQVTLTALGTVSATLPIGTHTLLARDSYSTTATAAGITVLTVSSQYQQFFTGSTTQTVTLPVVSTLTLGFPFRIVNLSSGNVTVQSSGANTVVTLSANTSAIVTCVLTSGTTAASWSAV